MMPANLLSRLALLPAVFITLLAGCSRPVETPDRVKIVVDVDGVHEVSANALAEAGFQLGAALPDRLSLTSDGRPVAFAATGKGRNATLRFYGEALESDAYTAENVYWLSRSGTASTLIGERTAAPKAGQAPQTIVSDTLRFEENLVYQGQSGKGVEGETLWFWESLFAPTSSERTLTVPYPGPDHAELRLFVQGNSSAPVDPDHRLQVSLNDAPIADVAWDGLKPYVAHVPIDAGLLVPGDNRLTITAPGDTGAPADSVLLDRIELSYGRQLVLDTALELSLNAGVYDLRLEGNALKHPAGVFLWDITDPRAPVAMKGEPAGDARLRFAVEGQNRRVVAGVAGEVRAPTLVHAAAANPLPDWPGGADFIIVTTPELRPALKPLIAAREAQGLRVAVLDVEQVDDAFAGGRRGPESIRALVRHAQEKWTSPAPRYLLLAGDASYDPQSRLQGSEPDLVPTRSVHTAFSGWSASDVWYALPDDTPAARPTLGVGRLPARTADELAVMIDKTLAYERNEADDSWRSTMLLVADNDEPGFAEESAGFATRARTLESRQTTIDGDGAAARDELLGSFNRGTGIIGYFGHGSVTLWAKEKVLAVADAGALTNKDRLPVIFTVTCLTGFFEHPKTPSLAEALLRNPSGGAVAALVPSSAAVLGDQRLLAQALADVLDSSDSERRRLGDIVREAQAAVPPGGAGVEDILLTFNLLGDPTLLTSF